MAPTRNRLRSHGARRREGRDHRCIRQSICDAEAIAHLHKLGWRSGKLAQGRFSHLPGDNNCIDFSGWPLYCSASLPEATAYEICTALGARHDEMPWENGTHLGISHLGRETDATPMDVPLHPGAARWYRDHGHI